MSHAPTDALNRRLQTIRNAMAERALDALVVTSLANVLYLTNFGGSSAIAVVTADRVRFITDFRYLTVLAEMRGSSHGCPGLELLTVDGSYGVRREAGRRLSEVADGVFAAVRRGMSERELAMVIDWRIREAGFEKPAFETIVASGPQAALPHARPSERILTEGDVVVLDFGGVYDSYCVDLTRTVSMGPASTRVQRVHAAVLEAQASAIAAVRPGASRFAIDEAARTSLAAAGMGEAFGHGTGHGLGIEIHEEPRIARRGPDADTNDEAVTPAMVFTIEPGAYFPGWGGVRIEDDVVVTETGVELLTHVRTDLLEL
jgi:Xaa-Pro aminopeptidase